MAAFVRMLMIGIMDMLMGVLFAFVIVGMFMLIVCMTTHFSFTSKSSFSGSIKLTKLITIDLFNYKIISFNKFWNLVE